MKIKKAMETITKPQRFFVEEDNGARHEVEEETVEELWNKWATSDSNEKEVTKRHIKYVFDTPFETYTIKRTFA